MDEKEQKRNEWKVLIKDFKESGLSKKKWCEKNGVKDYHLKYWLDKYQDIIENENEINTNSPIWIPINLEIDNEVKNNDKSIIIKFKNCSVEVINDFDKNHLLEVLKVVNQLC